MGGDEDDRSGNKAAHPERWTRRACKDSQWKIEEGHTRLKVQESFLYAENWILFSTYPGWLQTVFEILTGLFEQVGLKTNVRKKVGMVCHSCQAVGVRSDEAYTRRMTGAVRSYKERQR